MMRLLVCAGGTAGHVMPALAVIERLRENNPRMEILALAGRRPADRLFVESGIALRRLPSAPLAGIPGWKVPLNLARNLAALLAALPAVIAFDPQVALSTGGYPSIPGALAARIFGRPLFLLDLDTKPGLAVRLQTGLATCVGRVARRGNGDGGRSAIVCGLPLRGQFLNPDPLAAREELGIARTERLLVVVGGSQGASAINRAVAEALPEILGVAHLVHITGSAGYCAAASARAGLADLHAQRYHPFAFVGSWYANLLSAADLVVSRAGAGALAEFAATATPAILVPGSFAGGHQFENALVFAEAGAAQILDQDRLSELAPAVAGLLSNRGRLADMGSAAGRLAIPRAAETVAEQLQLLARRR